MEEAEVDLDINTGKHFLTYRTIIYLIKHDISWTQQSRFVLINNQTIKKRAAF